MPITPIPPSLHEAALACLMARESAEKLRMTHDVAALFRAGGLAVPKEAPAPATPAPGVSSAAWA